MYSAKRSDNIEIARARGFQKTTVNKDLRNEKYTECIFDDKLFRPKQVTISSHDHQMGKYEQIKINLNPLDSKNRKWIVADEKTLELMDIFHQR